MKEEKVDEINENGEKEIDLLELGLKLWDSRRKIFIWSFIGAVIGIIVAFSIPNEYEATVKVVPETGEAKSGGNLSALAAFAGVSVPSSGGSDAVYPNLYPNIVSSKPFLLELLDVEIPSGINGKETITVTELLQQETKRPWWSVITGLPGRLFSSSSPTPVQQQGPEGDIDSTSVGTPSTFNLTRAQQGLIGALSQRINLSIDNKTSMITISVMMQDAIAAAALADTVTHRLKQYVTEYRTGKAKNSLEYAKRINEEAREAYYEAQQRYAAYADRNQGLASRTAAVEQERLQNEASLAFNLYNSTSQQVQLAEAKVQNDIPVFAVVEPATIPLQPVKPRKVFILVGFTFVFMICSIVYCLFIPGLKHSIKEKRHNREQEL